MSGAEGVLVKRHGKGESHGGERCKFGRQHVWFCGFYENGVWHNDFLCSECGRIEAEQ